MLLPKAPKLGLSGNHETQVPIRLLRHCRTLSLLKIISYLCFLGLHNLNGSLCRGVAIDNFRNENLLEEKKIYDMTSPVT